MGFTSLGRRLTTATPVASITVLAPPTTLHAAPAFAAAAGPEFVDVHTDPTSEDKSEMAWVRPVAAPTDATIVKLIGDGAVAGHRTRRRQPDGALAWDDLWSWPCRLRYPVYAPGTRRCGPRRGWR
jgi:hypothetical protein